MSQEPSPATLDEAKGHLRAAAMPVRDFANTNIVVVRLDEALAILNSLAVSETACRPELLSELLMWTKQVGEQPRERVAMGIAAAARGFHEKLSACTPSATPRSEFELDAQRLDWIEAKRPTVSFADEHFSSPGGPHVCAYPENPSDESNHYYGATFREALDNAMKGTNS